MNDILIFYFYYKIWNYKDFIIDPITMICSEQVIHRRLSLELRVQNVIITDSEGVHRFSERFNYIASFQSSLLEVLKILMLK